jgi:hypothetical protein
MKLRNLFIFLTAPLFSVNVFADALHIDGLSISKLRAVGNYSGETFDNTLEIWLTKPLQLPANMPEVSPEIRQLKQ